MIHNTQKLASIFNWVKLQQPRSPTTWWIYSLLLSLALLPFITPFSTICSSLSCLKIYPIQAVFLFFIRFSRHKDTNSQQCFIIDHSINTWNIKQLPTSQGTFSTHLLLKSMFCFCKEIHSRWMSLQAVFLVPNWMFV